MKVLCGGPKEIELIDFFKTFGRTKRTKPFPGSESGLVIESEPGDSINPDPPSLVARYHCECSKKFSFYNLLPYWYFHFFALLIHFTKKPDFSVVY